MMNPLINKVIFLTNKTTSIRLAKQEWLALEYICKHENIKRNKLFELINSKKSPNFGLTFAVRLFSLVYFRTLQKKNNPKINSHQIPHPIFEAIKGIV